MNFYFTSPNPYLAIFSKRFSYGRGTGIFPVLVCHSVDTLSCYLQLRLYTATVSLTRIIPTTMTKKQMIEVHGNAIMKIIDSEWQFNPAQLKRAVREAVSHIIAETEARARLERM